MVNGTKVHPLSGEPLNGKHRNGHARQELIDAFAKTLADQRKSRAISGSYDAARDGDEFKNYWANSDQYDADSANSQAVRAKLVPRSRYEVGNNGFADGIAQTYATDLVGIGPKLRMESKSQAFNELVEFWWSLWAKEIRLRRKLWCQAHAKHVDGEGFGVVRRNPKVNHPVKLDYVLYETEQFQTPMMPWADGFVDGIKFDQFGNAEYYDLLQAHPGAGSFYGSSFAAPERVPARFVAHWFLLRRPGQHRAVPECTSTLNVGAGGRRLREAVLAAHETAADFSVLLKTAFQPDEMETYSPFSTLDIHKRMMTALPEGYDAFQMKAEHPAATYESFMRGIVNEQARPKSMPYNKAACDSSSYNYASGRLDHQTYYGAIDVDREDGSDLVLDRIFDVWFDAAIIALGWLGGDPEKIGPAARLHSWDWPKHAVADLNTEATSNETKLRTGQLTLSQLYSANGEDFEDAVIKMAADYGVESDEMREILRTALFNNQNQQASMTQAETQAEVATAPAEPDATAQAIANMARAIEASNVRQCELLERLLGREQVAPQVTSVVNVPEQAAPIVHVAAAEAPVVHVAAPNVTVAAALPADISFNPEIIVNPTPIQVAAPNVTVEPPAITVESPTVNVAAPPAANVTIENAAPIIPPAQVTVEAANVTVQPADVHVTPPPVSVTVQPPEVHVAAPEVHVAATEVNIPAPIVNVEAPLPAAPAQVIVEAANQEFDIVPVRDPDTDLVVKYIRVPKGGQRG